MTKNSGSNSKTSSRSQAGAAAKKRRRKRRRNAGLIAAILMLLAAIAVFIGIGTFALKYSKYDKILPNVYISGVPVGGMTREEATEALNAALASSQENTVYVILPDQTIPFTLQQDAILLDVDSAVSQAYAYGRNSTNPFTLARAIRAAEQTRNDIDVSTDYTLDTTSIRSLIDSTASSVQTDLTESVVTTDDATRTITVSVGTPGRSLNGDGLYELVVNAFVTGNYSDISYEYEMEYPASVSLDSYYAAYTQDAVDATYDLSTGDIVSEVPGYAPDIPLDQANEMIASASAGETLVFTFSEVAPAVTADQMEPLLFRDVLASYSSPHTAVAGRTTNLRLACETINGTIVQPGETFSFNDTVGERTADKGYQTATVYVSGDSVDQLGGGVCQVASTIYTCCMYADLEIVEREPHMYFVTYVPGGLDATVYWGNVDFKFRNNTDYPIRIDADVSNGTCNISLVGTDLDHHTVKINSVCTSTTPFSTVYQNGIGTNVSGYTGYTYTITREVYDESGALIRTDSTEDLDKNGNLGTSRYSKRDKVIYSGITPTQTPITTPTPTATAAPTPTATAEPVPSSVPSTTPVEPTVAPTETPADPVVVPETIATGDEIQP